MTNTTEDAITPASPAHQSTSSQDTAREEKSSSPTIAKRAESPVVQALTIADTADPNPDPLNFGRHRRDNVSKSQMKIEHPRADKRKMKKFYSRQNEMIDQFLGADDEERLQVEEDIRVAPKIKFAVNASFVVNFCLFVIQMYAAVSTGSLSVCNTHNPSLKNDGEFC